MLAKSSTEIVRQQNSALVLAQLRRHGPLAHTEISDRTGLSSATVSAITAELERQDVIERLEQASPAGRGRPRVAFSQRRKAGYLVTVRISSDQIEYSLVDYGGTLTDRLEETRRGQEEASRFAASLRQTIERLCERSSLSPREIRVVSISSKGLVDPLQPVLLWSPVFGDQAVDFDRIRGGGLEPDILLSNETRLVAGALVRMVERHAEEKGIERPRALCALSLGHGIGLGIAHQIDGTGEYQITAPDFGHMLHLANGGLCRCGSVGCIEATSGFYGILRTAFEVPPDTIPARFVPLAEMEKLAATARRGDRQAQFAFRQAGLALGQGLGRMESLNGRMPIYVTGPGVRFYDLMERGVTEGLQQSRTIRREGMPDIHLILDETALVFAGHLDLGLEHMDRNAIPSGQVQIA